MIFGSDRGLAKSYLADRLICDSTVFSSWESVLLNEHWTRRRRCLVEVASRGHALTSKTKTNGGPLQVESPESSIANHCRQCAQPHNLCKIVSGLLLLKRSPPNLETVAILTKNGLNKTQANFANCSGAALDNSDSLVPEGDMFLLSVVKVMLAPGAAASLSFALGFFYELKL